MPIPEEVVDELERSNESGMADDKSSGSAPEPIASRTRQQSGKSILRPSKYSMATKLDKQTERDPKKLEAMKKAEREEVVQLFPDLKAVEAVHEQDVEGKAHGCHIFTVDKFLADGEFNKCKARIVLHGNEQDPNLYVDKSSPTVTIHSIFVCLAVAALHGITEVAKIDVKGAFIITPMEGPPVYMRCNPDLTQLIVEIYPELKQYVTKRGYLYCNC